MFNYEKEINAFVAMAAKHEVRMLMVGGGAVNFHGYQRHSADVDFWIDRKEDNLKRLASALTALGYTLGEWPESVIQGEQNISLKFSPESLYEVELITRFNPNRSFDTCYADAVAVEIHGHELLKVQVIGLNDLISSKVKSSRPKDLLDIHELKRINNLD